MIEDALAIVLRELLLLARDDVPILLRPVDHRAEFGVIVRHLVHGGLSLSAASLRHSLLFATCGRHLTPERGSRHISRPPRAKGTGARSEEHTSELQTLMRITYAVFCLKKKTEHTENRIQYPLHVDKRRSTTLNLTYT